MVSIKHILKLNKRGAPLSVTEFSGKCKLREEKIREGSLLVFIIDLNIEGSVGLPFNRG